MNKVFSWQEIRLPTRRLNREMLSPDGHIAFISCHLQGENTHTDSPQQRLVRFDRQFIAQSFLATHGNLLLESIKEGQDVTGSDFDLLDGIIAYAMNSFYRIYLELNIDSKNSEIKTTDCLKAFKAERPDFGNYVTKVST